MYIHKDYPKTDYPISEIPESIKNASKYLPNSVKIYQMYGQQCGSFFIEYDNVCFDIIVRPDKIYP